jgi:hypothetical protein
VAVAKVRNAALPTIASGSARIKPVRRLACETIGTTTAAIARTATTSIAAVFQPKRQVRWCGRTIGAEACASSPRRGTERLPVISPLRHALDHCKTIARSKAEVCDIRRNPFEIEECLFHLIASKMSTLQF